MSVKTPAAIKTESTTYFDVAGTGVVTPQMINTVIADICDSFIANFASDPTAFVGALNAWAATLPTSSAGLVSGDWWLDTGKLTQVP